MKISLKWLNDFIQIEDFYTNPQGLADLLTKAGLEVEEIHDRAKDLKNVVIGHIKTKDKHPNADKLSLCQVETENGRIDQIICGAQNHKAGDKVVVALPGAVLPGNFSIKLSKIRDVESKGMLCSDKELGLAAESEGIRILDQSAPTGSSVSKYLGLDDIIMELKVTPNRADCLSHYGLARELGCLLNRPVKKIEPKVNLMKDASVKDAIHVSVENSDLCLRYSGRSLRNVKVSESPAWLKQRIESVGLNSINNVVDVTNYVMFELGQPLHAFDADLLAGSKIVIRSAMTGEKMTTLKEQELILKGDELLICDGEKPVAMAGVIGGLNSGVQNTTKNLFIESANFNPMAVRRASKQHGIETDSAYRFARGVDPELSVLIMNRACELIQQVAGGEGYAATFDFYPNPVKKASVSISIHTVTDRLGFECEESLFEQMMKGLQCTVQNKGGGQFVITPPTFRFDLEQEMDLVEEYARLKGYENINETIPALSALPIKHDKKYIRERKLATHLTALGYSEAFNYAFTSGDKETSWIKDESKMTEFGLDTSKEIVTLINPLSEELNVMRRTLSYQMAQNIFTNFHMGNDRGQLFSIGSVFHKKQTEYQEEKRLCLALWGEEFGVYKTAAPIALQMKSHLEELLKGLRLNRYTFQTAGSQALSFLHLGQFSKIIVEGKPVGFIGTVHPSILADEKIRVPVVLCEISLDRLYPEVDRPLKFKPISHIQPVHRDFAFTVDVGLAVGDLVKDVEKSCGLNLLKVSVFDVYQGDKMAAGQKSVALRAYLSGGQVALTDVQIQDICSKVIANSQKNLGAQLRS
jgi:phenylalanyl-tRNA synthetase beta chain